MSVSDDYARVRAEYRSRNPASARWRRKLLKAVAGEAQVLFSQHYDLFSLGDDTDHIVLYAYLDEDRTDRRSVTCYEADGPDASAALKAATDFLDAEGIRHYTSRRRPFRTVIEEAAGIFEAALPEGLGTGLQDGMLYALYMPNDDASGSLVVAFDRALEYEEALRLARAHLTANDYESHVTYLRPV